MAIDLVPNTHTQLPAVPQTVNIKPSQGAAIAVQADALARLKQKNARAKILELELGGLWLNFESGTKYSVSGFSPEIDKIDWILRIIELRARGKGGATTSLTFYQSTQHIVNSTPGF
jgi:hypothetical protein